MPKSQSVIMNDLQNNPNYVILNNPLSALKFVRKLGLKTEQTLTEVYTPKLFYEIITRLTPEHLIGVSNQQNVLLTINIKDFLKSVDTGKSRNLYSHILDCVDRLQTTQVKWTENGCEVGTTIIVYYKHLAETNEIEVQVHSELVKKVLELTHSEHFSFLKKYLYKLNNAQAIKLFPFFMSWRNKGRVEMTVEVFRKRFGCDTAGYNKFSNLKINVLDPAILEINQKTDLQISYKLLGDNLTGMRPRITGLQFLIKEKNKQQQLPQKATTEPTIIQTVSENKDKDADKLVMELSPIVVSQFGVSLKVFMGLADTHTEGAIRQAIQVTQKTVQVGKVTNIAGFFVEAVRGKYIDPKENKKQVEVEQKAKLVELNKVVEATEKKVINQKKAVYQHEMSIFTQLIEEDESLIQTLIDKIHLGISGEYYKKDKSFEENLKHPLLQAVFLNILKEAKPQRFGIK
jgi:hypothetical protein